MSHLPYLCHFRTIIHTYEGGHEDFELSTWVDTFEFRNIKDYEKYKANEIKYLDSFIKKMEGSSGCYNDNFHSAIEYGKEMIECGDMISRIIECDIKPDSNEHYYEIIGKFHFHSYQTYEGEWDSDDDISDLKFQEISREDFEEWAKDQGIKLL